jgi:hypothetical protein
VQAASEYYFDKDVGDLNWSEGALLAALIRSPSYYDPFKNPERGQAAEHIVFKPAARHEAPDRGRGQAFYEQVPLPTVPNPPIPPSDYFVEEVKQQLLDDPRFGLGATPAARNRTVFEGGIRVFTTFDPVMQFKAIQARDDTLPNNKGDGTFDINDPKTGQITFGTEAIASIEPSTGAVRVHGRRPRLRAVPVQPGHHLARPSAGLVHEDLHARHLFENGFVPSDTVSGGRCNFDVPGQSENYSGERQGRHHHHHARPRRPTTAPSCASVRSPAWRRWSSWPSASASRSELYLNSDGGPAHGPAVEPPARHHGGHAARHGGRLRGVRQRRAAQRAVLVERIEDRNGKVIYQHQSEPERIVSTADRPSGHPDPGGQRHRRHRPQRPDLQRSARCRQDRHHQRRHRRVVRGLHPQLATAVWMGAPEGAISLANAGLGGATGGRYPAKTWGTYYSLLMADQPTVDFRDPESTRRGKSVGKIPYEVGGSSQPRSSRPRRSTTGTTTPGGTATTTPGSTPPATSPPATAPPATQPPGPGG